MAVPAHHQQPRQGQPQFGADYMDDALMGVSRAKMADTMLCRILRQKVDHTGNIRPRFGGAACGNVMIGYGEGQIGVRDGQPPRRQLSKAVVRALMHQMPVHP